MDKIERFYDGCVEHEWKRLDECRLEFGLTTRLLDRFIPPRARVLDVGGGPGRYAFYLAGKGRAVTLCDLSAGNVAFAREHAEKTGIRLDDIFKSDVLDLETRDLGVFDAVLCMGPLYHLQEEEQRIRAVANCLPVLRPGGVFVAAFISAWAPLIETMRNRPAEFVEIKNRLLRFLQDGKNTEGPENRGFTDAYFIRPERIDPFMTRFALEKITLTGTEGLCQQTFESLRALGEKAIQAGIDIAEVTGTDPATWASCDHFLYIGRKK